MSREFIPYTLDEARALLDGCSCDASVAECPRCREDRDRMAASLVHYAERAANAEAAHLHALESWAANARAAKYLEAVKAIAPRTARKIEGET